LKLKVLIINTGHFIVINSHVIYRNKLNILNLVEIQQTCLFDRWGTILLVAIKINV